MFTTRQTWDGLDQVLRIGTWLNAAQDSFIGCSAGFSFAIFLAAFCAAGIPLTVPPNHRHKQH